MLFTNEYYNGYRYNFKVNVQKIKEKYLLEINSQHIESKKKSSITNLNFLISDLIKPILGIDVEDNFLILTKKECDKLLKRIIKSFKDKSWVKLLEEYLDEDREEGEWNANFSF